MNTQNRIRMAGPAAASALALTLMLAATSPQQAMSAEVIRGAPPVSHGSHAVTDAMKIASPPPVQPAPLKQSVLHRPADHLFFKSTA